jgi:hypothetical protein
LADATAWILRNKAVYYRWLVESRREKTAQQPGEKTKAAVVIPEEVVEGRKDVGYQF